MKNERSFLGIFALMMLVPLLALGTKSVAASGLPSPRAAASKSGTLTLAYGGNASVSAALAAGDMMQWSYSAPDQSAEISLMMMDTADYNRWAAGQTSYTYTTLSGGSRSNAGGGVSIQFSDNWWFVFTLPASAGSGSVQVTYDIESSPATTGGGYVFPWWIVFVAIGAVAVVVVIVVVRRRKSL